jgi:hypothetical protein
MAGANRALYGELHRRFSMVFRRFRRRELAGGHPCAEALGLYGAIVGKAYYTGATISRRRSGAGK